MWKARLKDGSEISQFNAAGEEVMFSEVLRNLPNLDTFLFTQGSRQYSVSMDDGKFTATNSGISSDFYATSLKIDRSKLENIRPIFFVRETVEFKVEFRAGTGEPISATVNLHGVGFQANLNGVNIKRYLAILPDGTYTIEDE